MKPSEFNKHITKFALIMGITSEIPTEYCAVMPEVLAQVGLTDKDILECLGRMTRDSEFQTYNRFPALPEFRRYHPIGNPQIGEATHRAELLDWIAAYCDEQCFFPMDEFKKFITRRDQLVIGAAGGLDGIYRAANSKYSSAAVQCKRLGEIWDSISADEKVAVRIGIAPAHGGAIGIGEVLKHLLEAK